MVDACVTMLKETGWLNFRMRAMLVSVAACPLWLHWRPVGEWLATQFLDYEPGIHWSQFTNAVWYHTELMPLESITQSNKHKTMTLKAIL
jgi:deoxyribodipyrimidine photolyase